MNWFNDFSNNFVIFITIIYLIGVLGFISSIYHETPNIVNENLEKTTEYMVDNPSLADLTNCHSDYYKKRIVLAL